MKTILFLIMLAFTFSCGSPQPEPAAGVPDPIPQPTPKPGTGSGTSFAEAQSIMQEYCAECHANAGFLKTEAALKASSAKARVQNSSMPPPYANPMGAAEKQKFLGFF